MTAGVECSQQAVERQFEEPVGVVAHFGALHARECGIALRGQSLLCVAVLLLAAADLAAWGPAGFCEHVADDQPAEAVEPVGGLFFAQAGFEEDRGHRLDRRERGLGDRGSRAEQWDDVGMGEEGGACRARGGSKVLVPVPGGWGYRYLSEDERDEAVEQCGLVCDVAVDGHWVDPQLGAESAHGQLLKAVLVDDPQGRGENLISGNARWSTALSERRFDGHDDLFYGVEMMFPYGPNPGAFREAVLR